MLLRHWLTDCLIDTHIKNSKKNRIGGSRDQRRHVTSRSKSRPGYLRLNVWTVEQFRANCSNGTDTAFYRTYSCK